MDTLRLRCTGARPFFLAGCRLQPQVSVYTLKDQQDRDFTLQDFKDGISNILIATSVAARGSARFMNCVLDPGHVRNRTEACRHATGIDVKNVILVVNFKVFLQSRYGLDSNRRNRKVPDHLEDYIHRIGRTGRAGKLGAW